MLSARGIAAQGTPQQRPEPQTRGHGAGPGRQRGPRAELELPCARRDRPTPGCARWPAWHRPRGSSCHTSVAVPGRVALVAAVPPQGQALHGCHSALPARDEFEDKEEGSELEPARRWSCFLGKQKWRGRGQGPGDAQGLRGSLRTGVPNLGQLQCEFQLHSREARTQTLASPTINVTPWPCLCPFVRWWWHQMCSARGVPTGGSGHSGTREIQKVPREVKSNSPQASCRWKRDFGARKRCSTLATTSQLWQEPPMGTAQPLPQVRPPLQAHFSAPSPEEGPAPAPSGVPAGPWGEPGGQKSKANCGSQWCGAAGGLSGCRVTLIPLS